VESGRDEDAHKNRSLGLKRSNTRVEIGSFTHAYDYVSV
jgi:hypothetical protein